MCGIVGSIGLTNPRQYIINGLKTLDYRGYDSAGLAFLNKGIKIFKDVGSIEHLNSLVPLKIDSSICIGHTRWSTHGKPSKENSHPHISLNKKLCLVHNGVIENFSELKTFLLNEGYSFYGDTDSEVVVNLLEYQLNETEDLLVAMRNVMGLLKGSYAIALIDRDDSDHIYVMKNASPLVIGRGRRFSLVASDASPMIDLTDKFIELDDHEYGYVSATEIHIFKEDGSEVKKDYIYKDIEAISHDLKGYPHYMLKEIEEIHPVIERLIDEYYQDRHFTFDSNLLGELRNSDHIIFIGCGTSYHSSLVGGRYFENVGKSTTKYIASEWAFHPTFPGDRPFIVLISQSGETADLIHCLHIIKEHNLPTLVITNTGGSTLDRNCTFSLLLHAGIEVSVASTKAYAAQVTLLAMLSAALVENYQIVESIRQCLFIVDQIRNEHQEAIKAMAQELKDKNNVFYLGRSFDYFLSLEASLKLKEVSYIHSEAVPGGELKHGPIALIEQDTPVIVFVTDPVTATSMRGNIEEVKSRGAKVYVISTKECAKEGDVIIVDNYEYDLSSIAISSVAFYLAYYTSLARGLDVDKPRNLAKSVTVE